MRTPQRALTTVAQDDLITPITASAAAAAAAAADQLSSAHAQAVTMSEQASSGEALRAELQQDLYDAQQQLAALAVALTDSNTVS